MKTYLKNLFIKYNIKFTELSLEQFELYYSYLIEQNKMFNLTAITDVKEVCEKHFLDSVLCCDLFPKNAKVIDIGAGAGFPSLPLKIIRPDLEIVMIDSLQKRVNFLNETIKILNLQNISALHERAEDYAKIKRECFDFSVARAVAGLNTLCEYCLPFVKVGGKFLAYKSVKIEQELETSKVAIQTFGGKITDQKNYYIDEIDSKRNIIVISKVKETPKIYPRSKNLPKTKPLI